MPNFIYFPDHLVELPSPKMGLLELVRSLATEPLFRGLLPSMLFNLALPFQAAPVDESTRATMLRNNWPRYPGRPATSLRDHQSLAAYYSRVTGRLDEVDNILSAMVHGIWGGDVSKLSDA